jgi:hypothetical protein
MHVAGPTRILSGLDGGASRLERVKSPEAIVAAKRANRGEAADDALRIPTSLRSIDVATAAQGAPVLFNAIHHGRNPAEALRINELKRDDTPPVAKVDIGGI